MSALAITPSPEEEPYLVIEDPADLLPDLEDWGIPQVEPGVCVDSAENRRMLRDARLRWQPIYLSDGSPTELLQAISPEMNRKRSYNLRAAIMVDSSNPDSEYITGLDLLLQQDTAIIPTWVAPATRKWLATLRKREETGKNVSSFLVAPPGRCTAQKQVGGRCALWHDGRSSSALKCRMHLSHFGPSQIDMIAKARNRIVSAASQAADIIEDLANNATGEAVRLKASTEILDRAGVRGGYEIEQKVEVEVRPAADILRERLAKLAPKPIESAEGIDIVDAEVVE
jgi:hypothetical protein